MKNELITVNVHVFNSSTKNRFSKFDTLFSSVYQYQVVLNTGDKPGSVLDSNVYMVIYGERGDTGKRLLKKIKKDAPEEEADEKAETNKVSLMRFSLVIFQCSVLIDSSQKLDILHTKSPTHSLYSVKYDNIYLNVYVS